MRPFLFAAVSVTCLIAAATGHAQQCATDHLPTQLERPGGFPDRPLTLVVPYGPGGGSGQLARAMAQAVSELTGVAIEIVYKSGGSGTKGMDAFLSTASDGYTILEHVDDAASAHALDPGRPDPSVDLVPLMTAQVTFSQVYVTSDEKRYADWKGLVAFVRERGGIARIANVSREGSMERVNLKFMADHYGLNIRPVTFAAGRGQDGGAEQGPIHALLEQPGDVRSFIDAGKFRPILTLLRERVPAFPDTPALSDVGLDFDPLLRYRGFYAKREVPGERLDWLKWAFQKAYCQESFQAFNKEKYMHLMESFRDTEGSIALIRKTIEVYRKVYQELGMRRQ